MFKKVEKCLIVFVFSFALNLTASETNFFSIPREDGSFLEGYILPPENNSSLILFAIQGSGCSSTYNWFLELQDHVKPLGHGLVILEKQGISKDSINKFEYNQTNSLDHRVQDHELCIRKLNEYVYPDWNGEAVFLGESEGGMIASELAPRISQVKALMLFATGGGMSVEEEVKWVIQSKLSKHGATQEEIDDFIATFDEKTAEMINNPTPDKLYLGNTYKWWASLLTFNNPLSNLQSFQAPLYVIHGTQDEIIPIQSADLLGQELTNRGKMAITYQKLNGLGHNLSQPVITKNAFVWLESVLGDIIYRDKVLFERFSFPKDLSFCIDVIGYQNDKESNWKAEILQLNLARGYVEVEGKASSRRDSEGNQKNAGEASVTAETDNGWRFKASGSASEEKSKDGNKKREGKVEGSVGREFR